MYLLNAADLQIKFHQDSIDNIVKVRSWIEQNQEKFRDLPTATICDQYIDFDHLTHADVMRVVMRFHGRWARLPSDGKINYTLPVADGVNIRCYQGEPPPNCRVVYEEVHIPARIERRAKIMCKPVEESLSNVIPTLPERTPTLEDEIPF